jgi:hypothetical protein
VSRHRPRREDRPATRSPSAEATPGYAELSARPLHVLLFLIPILIVYELGLALVLTSVDGSVVEDIRARRLLALLFELFGAPGLSLAPLLAVVVLLVQHLVRRDPWRVRWRVMPLMALESLAWATPLFVLGQLIYALLTGLAADPDGAATAATHTTATMAAGATGTGAWAGPIGISGAVGTGLGNTTAAASSLAAASVVTLSAAGAAAAEGGAAWLGIARDVVRAAGAGLYEELVFRLAGVTLVHLVAADLLRLSTRWAAAIAVALTSLAFAAYHDVWTAAGGIDLPAFAFFTIAGAYFAIAFITRGFGIAVGLHVIYDLMAFSSGG